MKKFKLYTQFRELLADTITPVNIYLKVRDEYAESILLESSDYHGNENSRSIICCNPIASFQVDGLRLTIKWPDGTHQVKMLDNNEQVLQSMEGFKNSFALQSVDFPYVPCGLFGYMAYDAVRYFESVDIPITQQLIPDILYKVFGLVIVIDHFSNVLALFENKISPDSPSGLAHLEKVIFSNRFSTFPFIASGQEVSNLTDEQFLQMVNSGIAHCQRGDVFQIVLSRRFSVDFKGDEFNVYRALRSINPSPYLFYFDFGSFKIFGSSPEAQIQIRGNTASIYPIAGTFRRTGNDQEDAVLALRLATDKKENAEHVMLVDLARNDLSRESHDVKVEVFKEIQYYSHVIHLVSKVTGQLRPGASSLQLAADTFPAGTLSGAPKHKALTLISKYENVNRGFYGGAIGFLGFNGDFNHAIMIRTFLSKFNQLISQAGAGIVAKSVPASELQEVTSKLEALRKAIVMAGQL